MRDEVQWFLSVTYLELANGEGLRVRCNALTGEVVFATGTVKDLVCTIAAWRLWKYHAQCRWLVRSTL